MKIMVCCLNCTRLAFPLYELRDFERHGSKDEFERILKGFESCLSIFL